MLRICLLIASLFVAFPTLAADISGRARFIDGDTLSIGSVHVRLFGIDAPEMDQTCTRQNGRVWRCGQWARDEARHLFSGKRLVCHPIDTDKYGRIVARCFAGDTDIAEVLVREGIAVAYRRYSRAYVAAEKQASLAGIGVWNGSMVSPEAFRASARPAAQAPPGKCLIKGNISRNGKIYHLPGQEFYAQTRIDPSRGERWFCTEAEARAAGWRRARR